MEEKRTLYDYLYRNLKEQILNGYFACGERLPSLNELCEMYHVGIRTAKDVIRALKEEGLIKTEERKPSYVTYCRPQCTPDTYLVQSVLKGRTSILQVYRTMELLLPAIYTFSLEVCSSDMQKLCFAQLYKDSRKDLRTRWKSASLSLYRLLDASGNLLFRDVLTHLELYARIPFFLEQEQEECFSFPYTQYGNPMWIVDAAGTGNPSAIHQQFRSMYASLTRSVEMYLADTCSCHPSAAEEREDMFHWHIQPGRDHYYMQITRSLIDQIGLGLYGDGDFLPPEAVLAEQYKVSVSTIRKAIAMLNKTGFCQTYNVKGTQVTLFNDNATMRCMKNKVFKRDTLTYLSGLQFMAIAVRPAALLAFEQIDAGRLEELSLALKAPYAIPLDLLIRCVMECLPLQPYRAILNEVTGTLRWGYYYSFFSAGIQADNPLDRISMSACQSLIRGDKEAFAIQLSQCYCHILEFVRDFLADCGLPEARNFVTPRPELLGWEAFGPGPSEPGLPESELPEPGLPE